MDIYFFIKLWNNCLIDYEALWWRRGGELTGTRIVDWSYRVPHVSTLSSWVSLCFWAIG